MISTLIPALVLCGCHFFPFGSHSVPALGLLLPRHCSLVLVVGYFFFVAWALARCRCFLVDCFGLREEDSCIQVVAVRGLALLAQRSRQL